MRSRWNVQYMQRVLATDPIAYWPMDERYGSVSHDMVTARSNGARNGAYTGTTLGEPGVGDGRTAPLFDAINDFNNISSASLQAAFNGNEGTMHIWIRVSGVGVWTDGTARAAIALIADANNGIWIRKHAINNQIRWSYESGGVTQLRSSAAVSPTGWIPLALTWSKVADEVIAYYNGVREGAIMNGLGIWAGVPVATQTIIGALITTPLVLWNGTLAHPVIWSRPLAPAEVFSLGRP